MVPAPPRLSCLKALLVEDSPDVVEFLTQSFQTVTGLEVTGIAETAAEAIAAFDAQQPDVVILDLSLRTGSGLDVMRRIKQTPSACRVLVFTGHDGELYRERCMRAGADFFFSKNSQHKDLIKQLQLLAGAAPAIVSS
jgi:DNA-binding NarL/FixJ family response regulator